MVDNIQNLVLDFFKNDKEKTKLWFQTPNPLLGNIAPNTFIEQGREEKLYKIIKDMIEGNWT